MGTSRELYLYNPKYNIKTATTYAELSELTGYPIGTLMSNLSRGRNYLQRYGAYICSSDTKLAEYKKWYSSVVYDDEVWRLIDGTNETYRVSSYGRVQKSYKIGWKFCLPYRKSRYRRKSSNKQTLFVKMTVGGVSKEVQVHLLVAKHFLEGSGEAVAHKNGIVCDNEACNLEYVSRAELGRRYGGNNSKCVPVVRLDRETLEPIEFYKSARRAGEEIGYISYQTILDFINGKHKQCAGMLFLKEDLYFELEDSGNLTHEYINEHIIGRKQ